MTDFASLGIKIDSSQAAKAATDLDKLAASGARAAESIEKTADAQKEAEKSFTAGQKAVSSASRSIDDYIKKLALVAATNGKSARESKLLELATQGATRAQLESADALIRLDYLDPKVPRKLMSRLNQLANRVELTHDELQILRGVARAIEKALPRNEVAGTRPVDIGAPGLPDAGKMPSR